MCETQNMRAFKDNSKEKVCLFQKQANIHLFCEIHEKILALVVQYRLDNYKNSTGKKIYCTYL